MKMSIIFLLFCLIFALNLSATIINIPAEQPTIQAGINVAVDSDTILVQPGTYTENINYNGKAVILGSLFYTTQDTSYISQTIIDGNQDDNVVTFDSGEDSTSVLTGFTITNGQTGWGGGIYCWESSPSLVNVMITDNLALHRGGGVYCYSSSPSLENVTITGNSSWEFGGGIYCSYSSSPSLENVTITGNTAGDYGGGIYGRTQVNLSLVNCILWNNLPHEVEFPYVNDENIATVAYSDIAGGEEGLETNNNVTVNWCEGNIDADPLFVDALVGDYHLTEDSPCVDAGTSYFEFGGEVLVDLNEDEYYGAAPDMGAYESPFTTIIFIPEDYATIQEGIDASDDGYEIIVSPGTYVENIDFNGKAIILASLFYTTQDTSYIAQTIIDGNQDDSVVRFHSEEDSTSVLTGFTITNGHTSYYGGGINCNDSSPSLENLMVTGNSARYGGGINCRVNSSPCLMNVTINDNSAVDIGGGINCNDSNPSIVNVTIVGNSAEINGGGIHCSYNSSPGLENVMIANNSSNCGGGISCYESSMNLENVMITENLAEGVGGCGGGGVWCSSSSLSFVNVTITKNSTGYYGGGIFCTYSYPILENVTISDNSAECSGGGIYCDSSNPVFSSENRCNIYLNNTNNRSNGSDIYSDTNVSVFVDTFTVSNPTNFHAYPLENFTFDILSGLQEQINADLYVSPEGNNDNSGLTIDDPLQTIQYACSVILADSQNLHTIHLAEGIFSPSTNSEFFPVDIPDFVTLCGVSETGVILNAEGTAGVIRIGNVENTAISNLTISNGYAVYGGGIYCSDSSPSLVNVTITGNSAGDAGGGIYCSDYSSPDLVNVTITGNSAEYYGGGIFWTYSNPSLVNVTIRENSAYHGGGVYCHASSSSLAYVITTDNSAESRGGGIYCSDSNLSLDNVTITDNLAGSAGGGIFCDESSPFLVNCIFWNNSPLEVEFHYDYDPNTITIAYCDIEGGEEGIETNNNGIVNWLEGNIDADPIFFDIEMGDYHLTEDSPCIDAGTSYFEYEGEILVDLSEDEYYGIAPDMGAYEYDENAVIYYGDVSDNGVVDSYDASLVLMYVVGLDPLPELDPLPWSDWRVERADVNLSGDIGAIDAAYILQYVVGIISELPVVNAMRLSAGEITISHDAEYIYLKSLKGVISFEYELTNAENLTVGLPEVINDDCLYSCNDNKFALISAAGISGTIVRIPYQTESQEACNVHFQIEDNGNSYDLEYLPEDIIQNSKLNIQNYPNPFNPETNIVFELSFGSNVLIEIYNIKGQKVTTLVNEPYKAGSHKITWNATAQSSGIYLLRFNTAETSEMKKLILLK